MRKVLINTNILSIIEVIILQKYWFEFFREHQHIKRTLNLKRCFSWKSFRLCSISSFIIRAQLWRETRPFDRTFYQHLIWTAVAVQGNLTTKISLPSRDAIGFSDRQHFMESSSLSRHSWNKYSWRLFNMLSFFESFNSNVLLLVEKGKKMNAPQTNVQALNNFKSGSREKEQKFNLFWMFSNVMVIFPNGI